MFHPIIISCPHCGQTLHFQNISFSTKGIIRFEMTCCGEKLVFDITWEGAMLLCLEEMKVVPLTKTIQ